MVILRKFLNELNVNDKSVIYLIYFLPIALLAGSLVINITILLISGLFLYEIISKKKLDIFKNTYAVLLFVIFVYIFLNSIFIAKNFDSVIRAVGFLRFIILTYAIAYYLNIQNNKYQKKILLFWTAVFLIVTFDLIFEFIFGFNTLNFKSDYGGRLAGFTGDELKIGGYYFGFVLLSLSIFYEKKNIFVLLLIIFLITSYLIGERSNFIKVFLILNLLYFLFFKYNIYKKILSSLIPFLVIFLVTFFYTNQWGQKTIKIRFYENIFNPILQNDINTFLSTSRHISHYNSAIEIFNDNKIFGVGIKNFRNESYHRQINLGHKYQASTHPHQIHFELLSELGALGYILMMFFLIYSIINGFRAFKTKNDPAIIASVLFVLATILPILPSGSFFTTYGATIFWINFSFIVKNYMTTR